MLLEELVLHNFGVYKGRNVVDLSPSKGAKPIVLIGALNGSGKTTIMDALQLALYGKFACCSNRGSLSYHNYLRSVVNHNVSHTQGAGLELQFLHKREGQEERFRIVRTWRGSGKGMSEKLEVYCEDKFDAALADRWYEYVDEFIPAAISELFFFDGEKIEALADTDNSAELIRTGIHALLGLDLVDQLNKDLGIVIDRRRAAPQSEQDGEILSAIELDITNLEKKRSTLHMEIGSAQNSLDQFEKELKKADRAYQQVGGEIYEKRELLESNILSAQERCEDADIELREMASGPAPLSLVMELLNNAYAQANKESQLSAFKELRNLIVDRDKAVVDYLRSRDTNSNISAEVEEYLANDVKVRDEHLSVDTYLAVDSGEFQVVSSANLEEVLETIERQLDHRESIDERLITIQRQLADMPAEETMIEILGVMDKAKEDLRQARVRLDILKEGMIDIDSKIEKKHQEKQKQLVSIVGREMAEETTQRVIKHATRARQTLESFRGTVAKHHVSRLESSILESFELLLRKNSLISKLSIDPDSYQLTLFSENGTRLSTKRLSAGERQLLAIAILWGLAKASGRPLPCIIDTPLGRLDSTHRKHVVEHYFPFASHQVILLSTDEEIKGGYYDHLKKSIGREYLINYDESKGTSVVQPGYFH